jgi:signal transduction histidine kinase
MTMGLAAVIAEREEARQRLEERVEERTRELRIAVRQLQDAQESLVRKERLSVLGELASGISHELRNPLGVMTNAVFYLNSTLAEAPAGVRKHLGILRDQVQLSEKIIENLLDFVRGKAPQRQATDLRDVVARLVEHLGVPENVALRVEIPGELPPLVVDPVQVGQIVLNLLTNAMQAMAARGGTLTVRGGWNGTCVQLEVIDTGPGILPENIDRIFEPFFTTKARGIGLGLAVSRALARANNCEITVKPTEGGGTTFTLLFSTTEDASG